jgi:hypothetical protein
MQCQLNKTKIITRTLLLVGGDLQRGLPKRPIKHRFAVRFISYARVVVSHSCHSQGSGEQAVNKRRDLYTSQYNTQ